MLMFAFNDITEGKGFCGLLEGGAWHSKEKWKNDLFFYFYTCIYDKHLNLAGNDFVMDRLIHINRSHCVFVF